MKHCCHWRNSEDHSMKLRSIPRQLSVSYSNSGFSAMTQIKHICPTSASYMTTPPCGISCIKQIFGWTWDGDRSNGCCCCGDCRFRSICCFCCNQFSVTATAYVVWPLSKKLMLDLGIVSSTPEPIWENILNLFAEGGFFSRMYGDFTLLVVSLLAFKC